MVSVQSFFMRACNDTGPMRAAFAMLLVALALSGCSVRVGGAGASQVARVGQPAPDFSEVTASGSTLKLSSLRGDAVYLNFFATWCPPCNEEAPGINALASEYRRQGLRVVGVDELEDRGKAQGFVRKYHLGYPAVVDDGTLQTQYAIDGLPVHVFIARSGVIHKIVVGEMSQNQIDSAIRSIVRANVR